MKFQSGQLITLNYEGREFQVVVIDPNGLGEDQPSVGFGFRMMQKNTGIPASTLSTWITDDNNQIKLPSGKLINVIDISVSDGNKYVVIEATDWFELAVDLLVNPGKTGKGFRQNLGDFLRWFAVKGFYAEVYVTLKGVYTDKDSRATTRWLESRQLGKIARKIYTDLLQRNGCEGYDYANWTDYVYLGLFGMKAQDMKNVWSLMDGNADIARNYIPEPTGLEAVAHCEDMTTRLFVDDLKEAHDQAINLTRRKFIGGA